MKRHAGREHLVTSLLLRATEKVAIDNDDHQSKDDEQSKFHDRCRLK